MKSLVLAAALLMIPLPAVAQESPEPGMRLRALVRDRTVMIGTLVSTSADSIRIADAAGTEHAFSRADLRLERSLGKKGNFGKHFVIATGGIAAAGGLISALTWNECPECWIHPESRPEAFLWGLAAGALVGLPIGIIAGLAIKVERWEPVALPSYGNRFDVPRSAPYRLALSGSYPIK